ncbi:hypothetical protein ETAA8_12300 [Anatilimnocola aggregata]|uniref:Uncharacterized protein n=2 Tax=Anatilimnocola aggregata TaxID=2528021 RepID=A0A517Y7E5_9BACT|nr:hypothetical protein ETAA8_12300 [Anatilimnocola aggregata]
MVAAPVAVPAPLPMPETLELPTELFEAPVERPVRLLLVLPPSERVPKALVLVPPNWAEAESWVSRKAAQEQPTKTICDQRIRINITFSVCFVSRAWQHSRGETHR